MKPRHLAVIVLLAAALIWHRWPEPQPPLKAVQHRSAPTHPSPVSTSPHTVANTKEPRPIQTIHSKLGGDVLLRNGESCIFSYFSHTSERATLIEITPSFDDEGFIRTSMRIVELVDRASESNLSSELLPDIFEFERLSALKPSDTERLHAELSLSGARVISYPIKVSRPGEPVSLRSLASLEDGTPLGGFDMSVTMNRVSEGIQLTAGLDLYSQRPSDHEDD